MKNTLQSLALSALILAAASMAGCASNAKCPFMPEKKCATTKSCCKDGKKMDCCKKDGSCSSTAHKH